MHLSEPISGAWQVLDHPEDLFQKPCPVTEDMPPYLIAQYYFIHIKIFQTIKCMSKSQVFSTFFRSSRPNSLSPLVFAVFPNYSLSLGPINIKDEPPLELCFHWNQSRINCMRDSTAAHVRSDFRLQKCINRYFTLRWQRQAARQSLR